jgi:hypothetical protein
MPLLYDAADYRFAVKAVAALRAARIPCYMGREGLPGDPIDHSTGLPVSNDNDAEQKDPAAPPEPDPADFDSPPESDSGLGATGQRDVFYPGRSGHCCIYIDDDEDYQRASEILLKLGAAREPVISAAQAEWINRWATTIALVAVALVALYVWENWKH